MMKKLCLSVVFVFLLGMTNSNAQGCSGQFKTFTIGGWGTVCKGNNPGCYRDANFDAAFPDGITIGCGQNTLTFTSSQAVEEFLPSGGTPALLSGALVDPAGTINNTLASQVLAVSLAVGFDVYDADFASSTSGFGSLPILSGAHAGMTVANFLTYANQVIGGCAEGDLSALNATATAINENYDNGTVDQSYLECNSNRAYNIQITSSVNCYGYLNGAVTVTVTGGSAPYHFELFKDGTSVASSGEVLSNSYLFTGLGAGSYTASVTDAAGIVSSGPAVFQVVEPVAIAASVSSTAVSCFGGSNGTATIDSATISGGVGPYTFAWANASTDSTIIGLSAGSYTVTVTDSLGCSVDFSVKVGQPTVLSYSSSITNVTCFGANNGSATITPAGGTAPYTILWDNQSTSFTRGSLAPSVNYTAVVTDANECTTNVSVSVTQPSTALGSSNSTSSVSCFGGNNGNISVTASGGTSPYTILWSTGETTFNRSNLSAETYTAVITDANGCTSNVSETITQPAVLGSTDNTTNVTCFGANNGSTTITPTGGTAPYTILWDNQSTSFTRGSLAPSVNYTAVVTDANECTTNVSVSVTQPPVLSVAAVRTQVLCYGGTGTGTATPAGGTAPYSYSWNTNPLQTSAVANLPVGTWTVRVTDANGCTVSSSVTLSLLSCEGFTTVTPGGYGAPCSGGNWGCYLATNFATKFPTGLQVGSGTRFLKFTSAAAVKGFLPSGTTARTLNAGTLTNPTAKSYSNVLAGHTVALTLSIGFDTNPAFSPSTTSLGSLVVSSGVFAGKSVNELLTIANTILGGGASPYTASQINAALDAVNRNYDNGTVNLGYLACPCTASKMATNDGIIAQVKAEVTVYPNPVKGNSTLEFTLNYDSKVKVVIYNINGQIVNDVYEGKVSGEVKNAININSTGMKSGVYIVKLTTDRESVTKSLLIAE